MHTTSKRSRMVVWLIVAFGFYVASHALLSRISMRRVQTVWGIRSSFLYLPTDPNAVADSQRLQLVHLALRAFYYPVWQVDHRLFGGPWPMWSMPLRNFGTRPNHALHLTAASYNCSNQLVSWPPSLSLGR